MRLADELLIKRNCQYCSWRRLHANTCLHIQVNSLTACTVFWFMGCHQWSMAFTTERSCFVVLHVTSSDCYWSENIFLNIDKYHEKKGMKSAECFRTDNLREFYIRRVAVDAHKTKPWSRFAQIVSGEQGITISFKKGSYQRDKSATRFVRMENMIVLWLS